MRKLDRSLPEKPMKRKKTCKWLQRRREILALSCAVNKMGKGNKGCVAKRVRGRPLAWPGFCHIPVGGGGGDLPNTVTYECADLLTDF